MTPQTIFNPTIKLKLFLGFGLMGLISLIMLGVGVEALNMVLLRLDKADDANRLVKYVYDIRTEEKNYILRGEKSEAMDVNSLLKVISQQVHETRSKFESIQNNHLMNKLAAITSDYDSKFNQYVALSNKLYTQQEKMEKAAREAEAILMNFRRQQKKQVRSLSIDREEMLEELQEADTAYRMIKYMLEIRRDEKNYQLRDDINSSIQVENGISKIKVLAKKVYRSAERQSSQIMAEKVLKELTDYQQAFNRFISTRKEQKQIRKTLIEVARNLERQAQTVRVDQKQEMLKDKHYAGLLLQSTGALAFILAIIISLFFIRTVVKPIQHVTKTMNAAANDDSGQNFRLPVIGNDEISDLIKAFNRFADKMCESFAKMAEISKQLQHSQKMNALGQLTGGIAHDYNNMLGIIIGFADLLKNSLTSEPVLFKYANQIHQAGERSAKLTRKLLLFSRSSITHAEVVNLNDLLKEGKVVIDASLASEIQLDYELENNLWPCYLDPGDFQDCILNLSINAMHAIVSGGRLSIKTRNKSLNKQEAQLIALDEGDYILVTITDTGCGISNEIIEKIFDPFFSTKKEQGSGLGLSQVYGFVKERSGGTIKVYSTLGQGTRFLLYFPRYIGNGLISSDISLN